MSWQYPLTPDEVVDKMNAQEAQQRAAKVHGAALPPNCSFTGTPISSEAFGLRESAAFRIERALQNAQSDGHRYARALDILNRHPEFEELIELLNMHLI